MKLASQGNRCNVDLLVKDTAGSHYNKAPPDGMVSSFGKPAKDLSHGTGTILCRISWVGLIDWLVGMLVWLGWVVLDQFNKASNYNKAPPDGMVSSFGKPAKDLSHCTGTIFCRISWVGLGWVDLGWVRLG